ncbi:MAG TPA: S9 family peptidase [Bryobacteraceae bacterium]|nr:S9 family peptidase [Bryobacteraceae bacterium]
MRIPARLAIALLPALLFAQKQPFTTDALLKIQRIGDPQVSPDGRTVAFGVSTPDLTANKNVKSIWVVPTMGGAPHKLTDAAERPRWAPDGRRIYYTGTQSGASQIWSINPDGSGATQVTHLSTEASNQIVSPDGKYLVVTSDVYPDCGADDACNQKHLEADKNRPTDARLIKSLLYRHWKDWTGDRVTHLISIALEDGKAVDLSPGERVTPPFSLGGPDDYAISPDSAEVAFSQNADPVPATGTNNDIYIEPITGGAPVKVSTSPGADDSPAYSPDGKSLAWRTQARAGYESDRWRIAVMDRESKQINVITEQIDRQVNGFIWSPDSKSIFFTAVDRGLQPIEMIPATGGGGRLVVSGHATFDNPQLTSDNRTIVFTRESGSSPSEIWRGTSGGGQAVPLTHLNDGLLGQYQFTDLEEMTTPSADGTPIQSFIVKPPGFNPMRRYPVIMLIHGGPQGEWGESWTYRWNAQVFAAAGYVIVMPNPRGSVGYGQAFTDQINQDWGGKPYTDIMAVTDAVTKLPYVDPDRIAAAGGSYGGYMINWILGHTNRFKALVSHDGVYDLRAEAESTEELWFPMWEFGGMPMDKPEIYDKWSPSEFVKDFHTPTLVIHGELDYRIPYTQALQLFTELQLQKVPSELLLFPDEGHWVLKPRNSSYWYKTFLDWIGNWTKP